MKPILKWHFFGTFPLLLLLMASQSALAVGTLAGREINNAAQADYQIGGVAQTTVNSNTVQVYVDELIDVSVVNDDSGPIGVISPQGNAIVQFTITNTGNGSETFRLIADDAVAGDDFDPVLTQIYIESNGIVGLQTGAGGDTVYSVSGNDPLLAADAAVTAYVDSSIPGLLAQNALGRIELRAVSLTLITGSGTDDPNNAAFPAVGTSYPGAGDLDQNGGGNVNAVVGTSHDLTNLLIRAQASYQVSAAVVSLTKSAVSVSDPFGGVTLVPGSVIEYQITASVTGSGSAENLVVSDVIPADLAYVPGSLVVSSLPPGEEQDDDFVPAGTDNTGFNAGSNTVTVNLANQAGGASAITITFQAAIR